MMNAKTAPKAIPSHHAPIQDGLFSFMRTLAVGWTNIPRNTDANKNPNTAANKCRKTKYYTRLLKDTAMMYGEKEREGGEKGGR